MKSNQLPFTQGSSDRMTRPSQDELVSIITPSFNCENYIQNTIESVIKQTYAKWELIIVDDASTDRTAKVVKAYAEKDDRIRFFALEINSGPAIARNAGLKMSRGNLIAFLDSDDQWYPEKLDRQLDFMCKGGRPITFTSYELVDKAGKSTTKIIHAVPRLSQADYLKNTLIGCSTAIVDLRQTGDFEFLNIRTRQDTHLWITLLGRGIDAFGLDEVLVKYRVHPDAISANKFKAAWQVWNLYRNIVGISFVRSAYYFVFYLLNAIKKRI